MSAVQLPPAVNTREKLEMLHWSTVASASTLPRAIASKRVAGVPVRPAAVPQTVSAYAWSSAVPYLKVSTAIPV